MPFQGAVVTFTVVPGANGASGTFAGTPTQPLTTGADGTATAPVIAANYPTGQFTVTAAVANTSLTQTFTLTNTAASAYQFLNPPDDPLAARGTDFTGINNKGVVVGSYLSANFTRHPLVCNGGVYTNLPDEPQSDPVNGGTYPIKINDSGTIVGYYYDVSGMTHGFSFNGSNYTTIDNPLAVYGTQVNGISNSGKMVGSYGDAGKCMDSHTMGRRSPP